MLIDAALDPPLFGKSQTAREARLLPVMQELTRHHLLHSTQYRRIVEAMFPDWEGLTGLSHLPFVPIGIFKRMSLKSVPDDDVFKTVTSSGTSGVPSRVHLDRTTARRQTKALTSILGEVIGEGRRPMLIVDTDAILADSTSRTARAAGVVGLMNLGRHHVFLLDETMTPHPERLGDFCGDNAGGPRLVFGFTFMIWQHLYRPFAKSGTDLSSATVVHSGGWKQMESERVDNETFKNALAEAFGISRVVNFYGMAEQVGSIFVEGSDGLLHPSNFADVIVRDPHTFTELPAGEPGVLQVLSAVPTSYPGHSILTEDLGIVETIDEPSHGLGGKAFRVIGRLPRSELRGCSDAYAATLDA